MTQRLPMAFDSEARRAQMFPELPAEVVARVAIAGSEKVFADGEIVFEQGDKDLPFYVVLDGALEIVHPRGAVEDPITVHDRPGEFTGEVNMIMGRRSLVRGRAKGRLRVLRVEAARFHALLQTDSELSDIVMRAFILRRTGLVSEGHGDMVIGSRHSAATLHLQEFLVRNAHPYRYVDVEKDPDIEQLLERFHVGVTDVPILICSDRTVLKNPTEAEVAECLELNASIVAGVLHDVVICGAGPAGLAAAVYGASEGLDVLLVEASSPGGQSASSSKIENYLGFPTGVSGQALAARALAQAEKFGAKLAVARGAIRMHCNQGHISIDLAGGGQACARAVVIATGAQYRRLDVPDLARFEGAGIYYAATFVEAQRCGVDEVIVVGGGNSAGQAATFLARTAKHVHVLIRGADLAASMSRYLIRRIEETPNITLHVRTRIVSLRGAEQLEAVRWRDDASGEESEHDIRHVFSMAGAAPNTSWLKGCVSTDDKGFVRTDSELTEHILREAGWPLSRPPLLFETSHPRIFAVGDVRANSVKRVASAVGEGSICIQLVHKALTE